MPTESTDGKNSIEILSQEISDDEGMYRIRRGEGMYRIRRGERIYYLTIATNIFDEDTMCRPYLLIPQLPTFPDVPGGKFNLTRSENGSFVLIASPDPLQDVTFTWHKTRIDVLSLPHIKRYRSGVFETLYQGQAAIAKIACFEWHIPNITRETWAYCVLTESQRPDDDPPISPQFLGHLTENGRVIGFLMEKLYGRFACSSDLERCEALLKRLHGLGDLGLVHGDINRYNFIVEDNPYGRVSLVDFEHARDYEKELGEAELKSLPVELAEETGRGSTITRTVFQA